MLRAFDFSGPMQGARDGLSVRLSASTPVPSNPVSLPPRSVPAPWWVLLLFWALVLLTVVLSLLPVEQLPREIQFWDKAQHALGFAGLAFLGVLAYARWPLRVKTSPPGVCSIRPCAAHQPRGVDGAFDACGVARRLGHGAADPQPVSLRPVAWG